MVARNTLVTIIFITFVKIYAFWWRGTPRKRHSNCEQKEKTEKI